MKKSFWGSDWLAGLTITIAVVILSGTANFQGIERAAYDWGVRATDRLASDKIAIIAIDDQSIANIGRWPWSRDLHAELISKLSQGGAKVVGLTVFFLEPQIDSGAFFIRDLIEFTSNASFNQVPADVDTLANMLEKEVSNKAVSEILDFYIQSTLHTRVSQDIGTLKSRLMDANQSLDTDAKLGESFASAKNVILAM
ncbi:MAG: CHASE2 domain-containing protein, partial [Gammaproteobacteria bacterium]